MKISDWLTSFKKVSWIKSFAYLISLSVVGILLLYAGNEKFAKEYPQENLDKYFKIYFKQPKKPVDTKGRPYFGNKDASIIVTEFSDFECPYCKKAAFTLKPILSQYQDQVKLVFMNYPLDKSCNTKMQRELHRKACVTAYAAYCSGKQGKFWEYHDMAFKRQPKFQMASLENIAEKLDLDLNKFKTCLKSSEAKDFITSDIDQGMNLGIRGTPSVFVNGRPFHLWYSKKAWKQLIDKLNSSEES